MEVSRIAVLLVILGVCFCENISNEVLDELNTRHGFVQKMQASLDVNRRVSFKCNSRMNEYIRALSKSRLWALKMFDATAKYPGSGVLQGNFVDLGFFEECLNIERQGIGKRISGQYCLGTLPFKQLVNNTKHVSNPLNSDIFQRDTRVLSPQKPSIGLQFGICIPEECDAEDLEILFEEMGYNFTFADDLCQTRSNQPELDTAAIGTLSFLGVILWIMLFCTTYDAILYYSGKKPMHPLLTTFSVITNGRKLLTTSNHRSQITCLHGIRVISTMWVILGHRYIYQLMYPVRNYVYFFEWMNNRAHMFIMNAPLSVDTFFLMAGLVLSYMHMSSHSKGIKFNIILSYIHRYVRLTPVLAVVILINATLIKHIGSGPIYPTTTNAQLTKACEQSWWKTLLYIQNYGASDQCISQAWYLAVDTQLFVLSPILLIPLTRWPSVTLLGTGILTGCSMLASFLTGWFLELRTTIIGNAESAATKDYMQWYYYATYARAGPWLIGIILGYLIFQAKQRQVRVILNKWLVLILWAVSLTVLCTCLFTAFELQTGEYNRLANSIHMALVRPVWAVAIGWIIYACDIGYGGPVNYFLSLPIFQILSKFTYTLYLLHITVIVVLTAQITNPPVFSNGKQMYSFWGDFAFTLVLAVAFTLAFESPLITIEKSIFGRSERRVKKPSAVEDVAQIGKPIEIAVVET